MNLNLGCGPNAARRWINCDVAKLLGVDVQCDVRRGLPFADASLDAIVAIHPVQDLDWRELADFFTELHRALQPGGLLRLGAPDLDKAIAAYLARDARYFYVPDEHAQSLGAKLVTQVIWCGPVRTPCTFEFLREWLQRAGFTAIVPREFGVSACPRLAALDNRERESLFVEAKRSL